MAGVVLSLGGDDRTRLLGQVLWVLWLGVWTVGLVQAEKRSRRFRRWMNGRAW
jgi:hypothetical protein